MRLLLLLCALAAPPAAPPAVPAVVPPSPALEALAGAVVDQAARGGAAHAVLAVAVASPDSPELALAAQTLVVAAAHGQVRGVLPLRTGLDGSEAAARAAGADWLVRLTVRLQGAEVTLAGDLVPTWVNFWAGQDSSRAPGGAALDARAPADPQALSLGRGSSPGPPKPEVATRFALRPLGRLPERALAVVVGDLDGDAVPEVAVLMGTTVVVLSATGQALARRDQASLPRAARASRDPAATLALRPAVPAAEGKKGARAQLLAFPAGRSRGEVLEFAGTELKPVQPLEAPVACVGAAGALQAVPVPGRNVFAPEVRVGPRAVLLPFGPLTLSANARPGSPAFAAVSPDGAAVLLDADLRVAEVAGPLGAALALGDVDGDGAAELVTTSYVRTDDRVRLQRADGSAVLFESEALPLNLVAAGAGDLDADGRDEVVLAGWNLEGGTTLYVLGAQP